MNNDEQTGEYENIFLNFYFRRRRQQRLGNKQLKKKRQFRIRNIFLWRDDFGIFNTLYQKLKFNREYYYCYL